MEWMNCLEKRIKIKNNTKLLKQTKNSTKLMKKYKKKLILEKIKIN